MTKNKPDWAERLQRTFTRKYDAGYKNGWDEGFAIGTKKALSEQRKVMIATIQKHIDKNQNDLSVVNGLKLAITIIRRQR